MINSNSEVNGSYILLFKNQIVRQENLIVLFLIESCIIVHGNVG